MTNHLIAAPEERKFSRLEAIKERSQCLREPVATELSQETTHFSEDGIQILKFHGSYQQDNRDNRVKGREKDYQFMLRTRSPGGLIPPQLFLALDRLASEYGNDTMRVTDRQGFQLHGILKKDLKTTIATIARNMGSTLGACGDLNRNVMAPPAPYKNRPEYGYAWEYANRIADLLRPQTGAYYEIWLDGEKVLSGEEHPEVKAARQRDRNGTNFVDREEPIYGTNYMPRKFKCSVTVPGDNSVDLFTQDLALVVMTDEGGALEGFNVFVGGGMGRTHNKEETFARLADPIGYAAKEDIYDLVKAIVATQRDYGERFNRRLARMKYLLHDWGVEKFRHQVEQYFGKPLEPLRSLPPFRYLDYLGWHEQGDGKLFVGLAIANGRILDNGSFQLKTALQKIVDRFQVPMRLTPNQNIILYEIEPSQKEEIHQILKTSGYRSETEIDPLERHMMACPALPTCGLAITESERAMPSILKRVRALLDELDLPQEYFVIRATGCPNGCARPYMAELAFVGSGVEAYQMWLGGSPDQTRLAQPVVSKLPIAELENFLRPLLVAFKQERKPDERFGDFCDRAGLDRIRELLGVLAGPQPSNGKQPQSTPLAAPVADSVAAPAAPASEITPETIPAAEPKSRKTRHRIHVRDDVYVHLKAEATRQGKPMSDIVNDALKAYLKVDSQDPA